MTVSGNRITEAELSVSPRKAFRAAVGMGWEVAASYATAPVDPVLYLSDSEEGAKKSYVAGDVRFPGYTALLFTVEARDPALPIGFLASYIGKGYEDKPNDPVKFESAMVIDPAGIPRELRADYEPIRQTRGDWETDASFASRVAAAKLMAERQNVEYNDSAIAFYHNVLFSTARPFENWLSEWKPFYQEAPNA